MLLANVNAGPYAVALALLDLKRPDETIAHLNLVFDPGRSGPTCTQSALPSDSGRVDQGLEALVEAIDRASRRPFSSRATPSASWMTRNRSWCWESQAAASAASPFLSRIWSSTSRARSPPWRRADWTRPRCISESAGDGPGSRPQTAISRSVRQAWPCPSMRQSGRLGFPLPPAERKLLDDGLAES